MSVKRNDVETRLNTEDAAEYWYRRAEMYRRQVGGLTKTNSKLKRDIREKDARIAELEKLLEKRGLE